MRGKIAVIFGIMILAFSGLVYGEDGKLSGEVTLTGVIKEGKDDKAKFNEYKDVRDGAYGSADIRYESQREHVSLEAKDIGYKTQNYLLDGGIWDVFRLDVGYDEIPHNFTYDARTMYSNVGTSNVGYTGATPSNNPDTWNTFDYSVKRKNLTGNFRLDLLKPFFLEVSANQQKKAGVYPLGAAGTSPGGIAIELPTNIDYTTNNFKAELGYISKPLFLAASYYYSRFDNGDGIQNFRNPATVNTAAATDTLFLPPENNFHKFDVQGTVKLPFKSKFSVDLSQARAESKAALANSYVTDVTAAASNIGIQGLRGITLSNSTFNGKVNTDNYRFAFTSNPVSFFDAKIFYKYLNKSNTSDIVTTTNLATVLTNNLFDYRKNMGGLELGFKLPASFRLTTGYTYTKTERAREDLPKNTDNVINAGLKWSGLNFMAANIGYEYFDRASDFTGVADASNPLEPWIRRFDAAARKRDTYKASLEFFPLETLSFNVGYNFKATNYNDTILGLNDAKAHAVNFDIDWQAHKRIRFYGYFDFEKRTLNQLQHQGSNDPATPPTATAFNWTSEQEEKTYGYGIGTDVAIIPDKLTLKLSHNSIKSDGLVDYTYLLGAVALPVGRTQDNIDLPVRDSYRLNNFIASLTYRMTKALSVTATYAFEDFTYEDSQYNGYLYYLSVGQGGYFTGAYSDPSYRTHIGFLSVTYKF